MRKAGEALESLKPAKPFKDGVCTSPGFKYKDSNDFNDPDTS
jgi:hypothetical protein